MQNGREEWELTQYGLDRSESEVISKSEGYSGFATATTIKIRPTKKMPARIAMVSIFEFGGIKCF
jgi:hypothetical protein